MIFKMCLYQNRISYFGTKNIEGLVFVKFFLTIFQYLKDQTFLRQYVKKVCGA